MIFKSNSKLCRIRIEYTHTQYTRENSFVQGYKAIEGFIENEKENFSWCAIDGA